MIRLTNAFLIWVPALLILFNAHQVALFLHQRTGWHWEGVDVQVLIGFPLIAVYTFTNQSISRRERLELTAYIQSIKKPRQDNKAGTLT